MPARRHASPVFVLGDPNLHKASSSDNLGMHFLLTRSSQEESANSFDAKASISKAFAADIVGSVVANAAADAVAENRPKKDRLVVVVVEEEAGTENKGTAFFPLGLVSRPQFDNAFPMEATMDKTSTSAIAEGCFIFFLLMFDGPKLSISKQRSSRQRKKIITN